MNTRSESKQALADSKKVISDDDLLALAGDDAATRGSVGGWDLSDLQVGGRLRARGGLFWGSCLQLFTIVTYVALCACGQDLCLQPSPVSLLSFFGSLLCIEGARGAQAYALRRPALPHAPNPRPHSPPPPLPPQVVRGKDGTRTCLVTMQGPDGNTVSEVGQGNGERPRIHPIRLFVAQ